jgi:hypothetical protein
MENVRTAAADTARVRTSVPPTQVSNPTPSPPWSPRPAPVRMNPVEAMPPGRLEQPGSRGFQPRHRFGASVGELIGLAPNLADAVGRMPVGGAHRDPPRTGRHRAAPTDPLDRLARRRTIGGRPDRGVGRTAL